MLRHFSPIPSFLTFKLLFLVEFRFTIKSPNTVNILIDAAIYYHIRGELIWILKVILNIEEIQIFRNLIGRGGIDDVRCKFLGT